MSWSFLEENESVFVLLNGRRVVDIDSGEEYGPVETIDHGKTADELWVSFFIQSPMSSFA